MSFFSVATIITTSNVKVGKSHPGSKSGQTMCSPQYPGSSSSPTPMEDPPHAAVSVAPVPTLCPLGRDPERLLTQPSWGLATKEST